MKGPDSTGADKLFGGVTKIHSDVDVINHGITSFTSCQGQNPLLRCVGIHSMRVFRRTSDEFFTTELAGAASDLDGLCGTNFSATLDANIFSRARGMAERVANTCVLLVSSRACGVVSDGR